MFNSLRNSRVDIRYQNFRQLKVNLKRLGVAQECIILPHINYWINGMIHDNSSCTALHLIFQDWVDFPFLSNARMSSNEILLDLINPTKLREIIRKFD